MNCPICDLEMYCFDSTNGCDGPRNKQRKTNKAIPHSILIFTNNTIFITFQTVEIIEITNNIGNYNYSKLHGDKNVLFIENLEPVFKFKTEEDLIRYINKIRTFS